MVTEPSHEVFLSYASQDAEPAQKICEALRAAGIEVFLVNLARTVERRRFCCERGLRGQFNR
jgi:hypothetical protein